MATPIPVPKGGAQEIHIAFEDGMFLAAMTDRTFLENLVTARRNHAQRLFDIAMKDGLSKIRPVPQYTMETYVGWKVKSDMLEMIITAYEKLAPPGSLLDRIITEIRTRVLGSTT